MTRDLAKAEPSLRKLLRMDADKKSAAETIPIIRELVPVFREAGTLAEVGLAALVYSLARTKVLDESAEVKAKWQLTSLVKDEKGEWLPLARTWADFCYVHLGLDPTTASAYKRVWEVYHVNLGFGLDDLLAAGIHKLRLAGPTISWIYPEIDLLLVEALFGSVDKCANCSFEPGGDVAICPSCGEKFEPTPPGSIAQVELRLRQLKEQPEVLGAGFKALSNIRMLVEGETIVGWEIDAQVWHEARPEEVSYLPPWAISVISDNLPPDTVGVREKHASQFSAWLQKHFG